MKNRYFFYVIQSIPDPEDVFPTTGYLNHFTPGGLPVFDDDLRTSLTFEDIEECALLVAYFNRIGWLCNMRCVHFSDHGMKICDEEE